MKILVYLVYHYMCSLELWHILRVPIMNIIAAKLATIFKLLTFLIYNKCNFLVFVPGDLKLFSGTK